MVDPAFFGKQVPLAGQRKPASTSRITRLVWRTYERLNDGRYLIERWMEKPLLQPGSGGASHCTWSTTTAARGGRGWGRAWY
jgi:hypothetical protein